MLQMLQAANRLGTKTCNITSILHFSLPLLLSEPQGARIRVLAWSLVFVGPGPRG